ncbi:MAG: CopG family transcriptional regulator [Syntrophales bacterium]
MGSRKRRVMSLSLSPDTAKEYREIAKAEGKTVSGLFRDIFSFYKQEKLKKEFHALQDYGAGQTKRLNITEKEIERLIFEGR